MFNVTLFKIGECDFQDQWMWTVLRGRNVWVKGLFNTLFFVVIDVFATLFPIKRLREKLGGLFARGLVSWCLEDLYLHWAETQDTLLQNKEVFGQETFWVKFQAERHSGACCLLVNLSWIKKYKVLCLLTDTTDSDRINLMFTWERLWNFERYSWKNCKLLLLLR